MNNVLECIYNLINETSGRKVIYGTPKDETEDLIFAVSLGDGEDVRHFLGGAREAKPVVNFMGYANKYIEGYLIFEQIKSEIASAGNKNNKILHKKDVASAYDKDLKKHVFTAQYKILN